MKGEGINYHFWLVPKDLIPQIIMNAMPHSAIISLLFFFSGFAGLAFEIVWCRHLLRALGAGLNANSCVFAAFLTGAAAGALICWQISDKKLLKEKSQFFLKLYGRLEFLAAISGVLVCLLLNAKSEEFVASLLGGISGNEFFCDLARFLIAFVVLLLPCACMGASFAALGKAFSQTNCKRIFFPILYGANTTGAAIGSLCTSFWLLPSLGLNKTAFLAGGINTLVFIVCELFAAQKYSTDESEIRSESAENVDDSSSSNIWALCSFMSGYIALVLEITWTRIFSSLFGSSIYSVGTVLFMLLLGTGVGSFIVHLIARNKQIARRLVTILFLLSAVSIIISSYCHEYLQEIMLRSDEILSALNIYDSFSRSIISRMFVAAIIVFPTSALLGSILPTAAAAARHGESAYGAKFYAINCFGGVSACIIFGAVLFRALIPMSVPLLISLLLCASLCVLMSLILLIKERKTLIAFSPSSDEGEARPRFYYTYQKLARYTWLTALAFSLLLPITVIIRPPHWNAKMVSAGWALYNPQKSSSSTPIALEMSEPVFYMEGLNCTISLNKFAYNNNISLKSDAKVEATLPLEPSLICPGSDLPTHVLLAGLPVLFHKGSAESGLLIGLGSGCTASALLSFPELKNLHISEIEPAVKVACKYLQPYNGGGLDESKSAFKRVHFEDNDARFVLSSSNRSYDVIVSQPGDPWVAGSADLFTQEFFSLAKSRLQNKGVFCQWLQIYAIPAEQLCSLIKTFNEVFPSTYVCHPAGAGELILLGFKDSDSDPLIQLNSTFLSEINERLKHSRQSNHLTARTGLFDCSDPLSTVLLGPEELKIFNTRQKASINTDDDAQLEFATCKSFMESNYVLDRNFFFLSGQLDGGLSWLPSFGDNKQENLCRLSRAFARQSLQDGTLLRLLNEHRADELAEKLSKEKESVATVYNRAVILNAFQKTSEAEFFLQRAAKIVAENESDRLSKFDYYFEADKLAECSSALEQLDAEDPQAIFRKALLFCREKRANDALNLFRELKNENSVYLPCILSSAYASASIEKFDDAENFFAEYLSINPWDFNSQLAYTSMLSRANKMNQALSHASTCFRLRPNDASAMILVSEAAINSGNYNLLKDIQKWLKQHTNADSIGSKALDMMPPDNNYKNWSKQAQFSKFAHFVRSKAEDPNNGYKVLGEP
jgi:spermidine synthase